MATTSTTSSSLNPSLVAAKYPHDPPLVNIIHPQRTFLLSLPTDSVLYAAATSDLQFSHHLCSRLIHHYSTDFHLLLWTPLPPLSSYAPRFPTSTSFLLLLRTLQVSQHFTHLRGYHPSLHHVHHLPPPPHLLHRFRGLDLEGRTLLLVLLILQVHLARHNVLLLLLRLRLLPALLCCEQFPHL